MKKYLTVVPLILIVCFAAGCQGKAALAELEEFRDRAALEEQNKALVLRMFEEMNKGNLEILEEVLAPDYALYTPSGNPEPMSKEVTVENLKGVFDMFPDIHWSLEEMIAAKDRIIIRVIDSGTHSGDFGGMPATGKEMETSAIQIFRIKDGKIVEQIVETDMLGFYTQIGFELKLREEK